MSYKTIAIHLDDGPRCGQRVGLAAQLAALQRSDLVGIAATGLPEIFVTGSSGVPDGIECVALSSAFLRERAARLAAGVAQYRARVVDDDAVDAVVRQGRCSDLVVVGQADPGHRIDGVAADFAEQILMRSGAPVLIVPSIGDFRGAGRRTLVAWKDTREASRALRDALPMLRGAERVVLLQLGEDGRLPGEDDGMEAARCWLASHGVAAEWRNETSGVRVGDGILSRAADLGADLIVMGGYGHSRARERVLGGATHYLLTHTTTPTLMSH